MKCQACEEEATSHVTELVAGNPVEYHLCEAHLKQLDALKPARLPRGRAGGYGALMSNPRFHAAMGDHEAREKVAAYMLPPLCLALLDAKPEVKIVAAFHLMTFGPGSRSAAGALRDAMSDPDERVREVAKIALEHIEHDGK